MNVPNIGQGPGSVATLPGPQTGGDTPVARGPAPAAAFARVAWFDLNGDGHIDNRNPLDGGDGTLIVPAHAVDVPTYSRSARRPELRLHDAVSTGKASGGSHANASGPTNDVQTQKVIDAYQRYGQATSRPVANDAPKDRAVA